MAATHPPKDLKTISRNLSREVAKLEFSEPIAYVYNPLEYAREPHEAYLETHGRGTKTVVMVGMNPGPFGMAQTGVPFGDVAMARDFLGITGKVKRPENEHPKRTVTGFDCPRSEVSGTRLWGWAKERFGTANRFFEHYYVTNYCPLVFMEESGRNFTPDKLPAREREALFAPCDAALANIVRLLEPRFVIGIGAFARDRARAALPGYDGVIGTVLHPSPASPKANKGWSGIVDQELKAMGINVP
jgi:single-strand selective monofunctional uracil DNA glycosylase